MSKGGLINNFVKRAPVKKEGRFYKGPIAGIFGFTLIEILVGLAIFVLVMSIAFSMIQQCKKRSRRQISRIDLKCQAEEIFDIMEADVSRCNRILEDYGHFVTDPNETVLSDASTNPATIIVFSLTPKGLIKNTFFGDQHSLTPLAENVDTFEIEYSPMPITASKVMTVRLVLYNPAPGKDKVSCLKVFAVGSAL